MTITVYTKPACVQCNATYRKLDKLGLRYEVYDITEDADARDMIMGMGYLQAPVVVVTEANNNHHWSGFRPDKIDALISRENVA